MGEEQKKPEAEQEKKGEEQKAEKLPEAVDEKKEEKKSEAEQKKEEKKSEAEQPKEIVLKVFMHCEGCARKVRRCLKGFEGVDDVITDYRTSKVVVKGEKADPLKVLERVQRKSHRKVELISPVPKPPSEEPNKSEEKEEVKPEEKKEEPPITVVLGVYMHCEACAQEIKKRIQRMKGVESAEPQLKSSQVTVKGVFEPEKLTEYVYKRTGKHAVIIKVEPEKKEEEKGKEGKEEKKAEEGEKEANKVEDGKENKEGAAAAAAGDGGGLPAKPEAEGDDQKMDLKKNEFYYYHPQNYQIDPPQRFVQDMYEYSPAPQFFSDENPNACSVM